MMWWFLFSFVLLCTWQMANDRRHKTIKTTMYS